MPLRILIVPDKFKGSLSAMAAAETMARGWLESRPDDAIELLPMSDGGDGFGEILARLLPVEARVCETVDAARRPCKAAWWQDATGGRALIESARVIGLASLPANRFHPFELDTFGLGAVIRAAATAGCARCLVGIGGSATNDGGFGVAKSLGWRFIDPDGGAIVEWTQLSNLARVEPPPANSASPEMIVAVDVQNPLLGPTGASRVYGPQKGLQPDDFPIAEACLGRLAEVVRQDLGLDAAGQAGSGAAGGLGFGLRCFLNARLESGFTLFAEHARLEDRIRGSDLVITGEGAIDPSTFMGKGVGEIARLSESCGVRSLGLAGTLNLGGADRESGPFTELYGIAPDLTNSEDGKREPELWLHRLAAMAAKQQSR